MREVSDGRIILLTPDDFADKPREISVQFDLRVTSFLYASGVAGLAIENGVGRVEVLPFVGQQVWRASFHGRELAMITEFDEPVGAATYVNYEAGNGAYLIHCGGTGMGLPGPTDDHPVHGQLPFAPHSDVELVIAADSVTVRGGFTHLVGSTPDFTARTTLRVTRGSGVLESHVTLTNVSGGILPLMYLAHANFRPAEGGHLEEVLRPGSRIHSRMDIELDGEPFDTRQLDDGTLSMDRLMAPGARVEPQLIQEVPAAVGAGGNVVTRVHHIDGSSDLVSHDSADLTHSVRWIRRSGSVDAFAFAMPATATPGGFTAENLRGNVKFYESGESLEVSYRHGMEPARS